jgi:hypothetical protein
MRMFREYRYKRAGTLQPHSIPAIPQVADSQDRKAVCPPPVTAKRIDPRLEGVEK